jgi:hypothetical protein
MNRVLSDAISQLRSSKISISSRNFSHPTNGKMIKGIWIEGIFEYVHSLFNTTVQKVIRINDIDFFDNGQIDA